jgi:NhaC family Na+:H+ antiporter
MQQKKPISLIQSFLPIIVLIPLLAANVFFFGDNSLGGSNQLALLLAAAVATLIGFSQNLSFDAILEYIKNAINSTLGAIIILLLIGALAGTWLISGVIPALIYYGLQIAHPSYFLVAASVVCAIISVASGSSWSTIATIGVALLGIGKALGFSEAVVGGAIITGAYFGDKMSPLSDTTNLAAAVSGAQLFDHIRYMFLTTVPSYIINLILFFIIGLNYTPESSAIGLEELNTALVSNFNITPFLFLVPALVVFLIIKKVDPIPALFVGILSAGVQNSYYVLLSAAGSETSIETGNSALTDLLSSGGMAGMLNTVWLIICAMVFGGAMEAIGALERIAGWLISGVKSLGGLVATTVGSCLFINLTASDQYLAIVVPGRMYKDAFDAKGLAPVNLSRTLEDSGTVTSVLIPWNTCGATQSAVLGVATFAYLPFCFFNYLSPIMSIIFAAFNIKIKRKATKA